MQESSEALRCGGAHNRDIAQSLAYIESLIVSQQLDAAEASLRVLSSECPEEARVVHAQGELLLRRGDVGNALSLVRSALTRNPGNLDLLLLEAKALLEQVDAASPATKGPDELRAKRGNKDREQIANCCRRLMEAKRFDEVDALALRSLETFKKDARFAMLRCRALMAAGSFAKAEAVTAEYLVTFPSMQRLLFLRCRSLFELGRRQEAADLTERALAEQPGDKDLMLLHCRSLLEYGDFEEAMRQADAALATHPEESGFLTVRGRALVELGRSKEFCSEVTPPVLTPDAPSSPLVAIYGRAMEKLGDWQAILDWLEPYWLQGQPLPQSAQDALISAYQHLDRGEDAKAIYRRFRDNELAVFPEDLPKAIQNAEEFGPSLLPNAFMTHSVIERLWTMADKEKWSRADWLKRMRWGKGMQSLIRTMTVTQNSDVRDLMNFVHSGFDTLKLELEARGSVLMVGAHVGAYLAIIPVLVEHNIPVCMLSKYTIDEDLWPGNFKFITATHSTASTLRRIQESVHEGRLIIMSGDSEDDANVAGSDYYFNLLGRDVAVTGVPPRLAHMFRLPTYWVEGLFEGNRIRVGTELMLPAPQGEDRDCFAARWWEAYTNRFLPLLSGDPSNLYMAAGPFRRALLERPLSVGKAKKLDLNVGWEQAMALQPIG